MLESLDAVEDAETSGDEVSAGAVLGSDLVADEVSVDVVTPVVESAALGELESDGLGVALAEGSVGSAAKAAEGIAIASVNSDAMRATNIRVG